MRYPDEINDYDTIIKFSNIFDQLDTGVNYIDTKTFNNWKQFHIANDIDKIIARAIQKRCFEVYYQPIWSTKEKRFVCAEALLRLFDDKYGFIPPLTLISNAEKTEAITEIGDIVLEKVASFIASPEFKKLNLDYIDVNLSPVQCVDPYLVDKICNIVSKYNISPSTINFEITETAISYLHNVIINNLEELAYKGFRVSLDDYGTGYSNIKRMVECPFNIIKLDKTFADECENERMKVVLKDTVNMLKNIEMGIVVEGVETSENAELFSELGCDYIQGYYYSKPMAKNEFIKFMESNLKPKE
jgi:EAL domain-containing protein (putative c-di-GMP-specific phosphodiesterase class I)